MLFKRRLLWAQFFKEGILLVSKGVVSQVSLNETHFGGIKLDAKIHGNFDEFPL